MADTSLDQLNVRDLKKLLQINGIDSSTCFEKAELIDLARKHNLNPNSLKTSGNGDHKDNNNSGNSSSPNYHQAPPPVPPKPSKYAHVSYYEILGLEKTADKTAIKKAYYLKARQCHPDKNPDDPNAEELFKAVSEAYTILTDDEKRKIYDKFGKEGLASEGAGPDPATLFKMMFGGGYFENEFGDLSLIGSIIGDHTTEDPTKLDRNSKDEKYQKIMDEKKKKLEIKLLVKLEPYLQGNVDEFKKMIEAELAEKAEAPGGPELLKILGNIYTEKAKQYEGRFLGIEGFFSEIGEKFSLAGQVFEAFSLAMKMASEMSKIQNMQNKSETIDEATQAKLMSMGLNVFWTMGKIEIDRTVHAVCEGFLTEQGVSKDRIKARASALRVLGEMYNDAGVKALAKQGKDAKTPFDLPDAFFGGGKKEKQPQEDEKIQ